VTGTGLHARIAIRPESSCPAVDLSESVPIREFVPGVLPGRSAQVVLDAGDASAVEEVFGQVTVRTGERSICRLTEIGPRPAGVERGSVSSACADCPVRECLLGSLQFLPVVPYELSWDDGWLRLSLAILDRGELETAVSTLREAGYEVDLRQLSRAATDLDWDSTAVVDLDVLTTRQRTVLTRAVSMGYFDADGAAADEVAAALDISTSTLSGHVRAALRKLLPQLVAAQ